MATFIALFFVGLLAIYVTLGFLSLWLGTLMFTGEHEPFAFIIGGIAAALWWLFFDLLPVSITLVFK